MDFLSQSDPTSVHDFGAKVFNDSVHGYVRFPGRVMEFIDTPQFQRLRDLKQLGTTSFVSVKMYLQSLGNPSHILLRCELGEVTVLRAYSPVPYPCVSRWLCAFLWDVWFQVPRWFAQPFRAQPGRLVPCGFPHRPLPTFAARSRHRPVLVRHGAHRRADPRHRPRPLLARIRWRDHPRTASRLSTRCLLARADGYPHARTPHRRQQHRHGAARHQAAEGAHHGVGRRHSTARHGRWICVDVRRMASTNSGLHAKYCTCFISHPRHT